MDSQITTALIGVVGVAGTVGGTVLGSWLQARGGRAQAQAARDAAETAANVVHVQAVRERVWTVMPAYLRAADEYADLMSGDYRNEDRETARNARRTFRLVAAEADLAVPEDMRPTLQVLSKKLRQLDRAAQRECRTGRAHAALEALVRAGDQNARRAAQELLQIRRVETPPSWEPLFGDPPAAYVPAIAALDAAGLQEVREVLLSDAHRRPGVQAVRHRAQNEVGNARRAVTDATRTALGTRPEAEPAG